MSTKAPRPETDAAPMIGSASVLTFGNVTTVVASGEFDAGSSDGLAEALELACTNGTDVVVDLAGVTFLDGAALRRIERASATMTRQGRSMRLANPPRVVVRLIRAAGAMEMLSS
jgi:anti-anti-sigma factor